MGLRQKLGGGEAWWLLLLAAVVLLAAAATAGGVEEAAERLRGDQRTCELKCQHHRNPENRQRCINYCIKYQLAAGGFEEEEDGAAAITAAGELGNYGGSQHICEIKCQHHKDPVNRQRCIDYCIKYQLAVAGVEEDEATAAATAGAIRQVV